LISGNNFSKVHALGDEFAKIMTEMLEPIMPKYEEFVLEVEDLQAEYQDDKIDTKKFKKRCGEIRSKYKDVLDEHHERNLVLDKMLDEEVEVDLELISIEKIPTNITGSFLNSIKPMLLY
jgi:hypothetical protein